MTTQPPRMTFVFGFRSPYAWLAHRLIEDRLGADAVGCIELLPFWNPTKATRAALDEQGGAYLYTPMSRTRHLYILHDVRRLAAHFGYGITWPVDREHADWDLPHAAYLAACRMGEGPAVSRALFIARFERGEDICDRQTVLRLTGLDGSNQQTHAECVAALQRCGDAGVFGLPFFLVGRQSFWGLDRLPFALAAAGLTSDIGTSFFPPAQDSRPGRPCATEIAQ